MKSKKAIGGTVVASALIAMTLFSTSMASGSGAPTIVKGNVKFEYKDHFLPGDAETFKIKVKFNSEKLNKSKATVKQGDQTLKLDLDCIVPGPSANSVGVAGKVVSVEGNSIHDNSFPIFRRPEVGDYAVLLVEDNGKGPEAEPDVGSRAFVFGGPTYPDFDCEALSQSSPPSATFTAEIEKGNYKIKNLNF